MRPLTVILALALIFPAFAREDARDLSRRITRTVRLRYLVQLPPGYEESRARWPVILFLHGGSGRGADLSLVKQYGPPALAAKPPVSQFIVVSPQCSPTEIWTDAEALIEVVNEVARRYRADPRRVYLTGMSMGGRGTWYLAYRYPGRFAAIAPVCGAAIPAWAPALKQVPVWAFHGERDALVPLSESQEMVSALRAAGSEARLTVLPGRGHDIADVFDRPELYAWFLKHVAPPK